MSSPDRPMETASAVDGNTGSADPPIASAGSTAVASVAERQSSKDVPESDSRRRWTKALPVVASVVALAVSVGSLWVAWEASAWQQDQDRSAQASRVVVLGELQLPNQDRCFASTGTVRDQHGTCDLYDEQSVTNYSFLASLRGKRCLPARGGFGEGRQTDGEIC